MRETNKPNVEENILSRVTKVTGSNLQYSYIIYVFTWLKAILLAATYYSAAFHSFSVRPEFVAFLVACIFFNIF